MTTIVKDSSTKDLPEIAYPLFLSDALNRLTKQELTIIRTNLKIANVSTLNKQALAHKLVEVLPESMLNTLQYWDQNRLSIMRKIVSANGRWNNPLLEIQQYYYYCDRGLLFPGMLEGKKELLMPTELVNWFKSADLASYQETSKRNSEWIQLTRGLLFYYGPLTIEEIELHLVNYSSAEVSITELMDVLIDALDYYDEIRFNSEGIFHDYRVVDPEFIYKQRESRTDLDYCSFTKTQLWKAGEPRFVEKTSPFTEVVHFLLGHYQLRREDAELLAEEVADAARNGLSLGVVLELVQQFIDIPNLDMMASLSDRLVPLMNSTKQWALKGNSPNELAKKRNVSNVTNAVNTFNVGPVVKPVQTQQADVISLETKQKVGRNDPCPCGSGKKFKKCCGN